jgi:hypothetical protein
MFLRRYYPPQVDYTIPDTAIEVIRKMSQVMAAHSAKAFRVEANRRNRSGRTLRPGRQTLLWNELRRQLRPHLRKYGDQANLGRLLGMPRQRVNTFVTGGGRMPDAERTLQLLVWLMAARARRRPG